MQDDDQSPKHSTAADPVDSVAPGVSLLDSILLLLTPEQRQGFLESAGIEGVVYANRAPTFDKPLALKIMKPRFRDLLKLIGRPALEISPRQWECDYDDPEPLSILKKDLEGGVRVSPPPRDWFGNHPEGDDVPIRIESKRFGIPCRVRPHKYGGPAYLEATAIEPSDFSRSSEPSGIDDAECAEDALDDPVDVDHLTAAPAPVNDDGSGPSACAFAPHFVTTWDVLGPNSKLSPEFDRAALGRLVSQLVTNGLRSAISRATRERCEMLEGLLRLKQFASQYPYSLARHAGGDFELQVQGPPEALNAIKRACVYQDAADGSRRDRVSGVILERVGRRNQHQMFRIPEGFQSDAPPASGYLVDSGDISQLQKQLNALRELRHPSSRPHLLLLGTLLGSEQGGLGAPAPWESSPIRLVDGKLTERQAEAVRKAMSTPDVCLIQGPPGTGKTRVISEIVRQAVRANQKVLLVAPTHVAVDNVLERIGIQEEVSPVRCVRQEKLDDLPEHIQNFTYERRSGLLANETGRLAGADRSAWQRRLERLESALGALKQGASYRASADLLEGRISALGENLSHLPEEVRLQFANEAKVVGDGRQAAVETLARAEQARGHCGNDLSRCAGRVTDLGEHRYTANDRDQVAAAEAVVRREHAPALESATVERDRSAAAVSRTQNLEAERRSALEAAREILREMDAGRVPSVVQGVIDVAVAETTSRHDAIVAERAAALAGLQSELADVQRRVAQLDEVAEYARGRARSLKEAQAKAIPMRLLSGAWWGAFFKDYGKSAAEASGHSIALQGECTSLRRRIHQAEESLEDARAGRLLAVEETRRHNHERQFVSYREAVATLPGELEHIGRDLADLVRQADLCQAVLQDRLEACRRAVDGARGAAHGGLLADARAALDRAHRSLADSEAKLADARNRLADADGQVEAVAGRIRERMESRTRELCRYIEAQQGKLTEVRQSFAAAIAPLADLIPVPLPFEAEPIAATIRQLADESERARRRVAFLEEWTRFLGGESERLRDRLSQYVNLVCATTVGIASDEYFGDKGAFVEKQFDLLVIDEAGKVTEPEFLVAAVRAKRWVLVGDHKQLPPYYDQILDPYLCSANDVRRATGLPLLDGKALQLSVFERLWLRYNPEPPPGSAGAEPADAEGERIALSGHPLEGPPAPRHGGFDRAGQLGVAGIGRGTDPERGDTRGAARREEAWLPLRNGFDRTPARSPLGEPSREVRAIEPSADGDSRCVTLDVQRRMHPDLAVFISEMFYGGRYYSPDDAGFLQSKSLDLAHFPKPVTFIDISAVKGTDGNEVDLSVREQRKKHLAEHDAELPDRGFANLREAEQVVQVLEAIVADAALDRELADLQCEGDQVPPIGVIALYAGQVALIHRLILASPSLRGERVSGSEWLCGGARVAVNSVDAFQGKECPVIILSFTRSNRRQAVGFVDDPHRLNVALSRARKKLILVGDSETLTRRARHPADGAKDGRAARQERLFFTQLIRYVDGRGKTMRVFERRTPT